MKCLIIYLCALLLAFVQASAASNNTIQIQMVRPLYFGGLIVSPSGGSITLTEDGALIPDGSGVMPGARPPSMEAIFKLTGPPHMPFTLSMDPQTPMLTSLQGGVIRLAEFHCSLPGLRGTLDTTGQLEVKLGGRLDISANVVPGVFLASQVKLQVFPQTGHASAVPFTIGALVRAPLLLSNLGPLDFGWLIPGSRQGAFEVLPGGGFRDSGHGGPFLVKGAPKPAIFLINGLPGSCYSIQLPRQVQLTGPGGQMTVRDFTCNIPLSGALPPGGQSFAVGASLLVDPAQTRGDYRGTFMVTVNYP